MIDLSSLYRSELSDDRYVDLVCVGLDCLMMDRSSLRGSGLSDNGSNLCGSGLSDERLI